MYLYVSCVCVCFCTFICDVVCRCINNRNRPILRPRKYRIFRTISRDFFRKSRSSGLYNGATYVQMLPKSMRYTLQLSTASIMVTAAVEYLPTYLYATCELVTSTSDSPRPGWTLTQTVVFCVSRLYAVHATCVRRYSLS